MYGWINDMEMYNKDKYGKISAKNKIISATISFFIYIKYHFFY